MRLHRCVELAVATTLGGALGCAAPLRDVVEDAQSRMVQIQIEHPDGTYDDKCGQGLVLGPHEILTAAHVVGGENPQALRLTVSNNVFNAFDVQPTQYRIANDSRVPEHLDVVLLKLDKNLNFSTFDRLGWIDEHDIDEYRAASVVSFHDGTCKGVKDVQANGGKPWGVEMQRVTAVRNDGVASPRIQIDQDLGAGYSGSMVVSRTFGGVIAVYGAGVDGGYATSIEHVKALFETGAPTPRDVEHLRLDKSVADVGVTIETVDGGYESLDRPLPGMELVGRFMLWHDPFWLSHVHWAPTFVLQAGLSSWRRRQVVIGYPGVGVRDAGPVTDTILAAAPSLGLRFEWGNWLLALDGLAGAQFSKIFGDSTSRTVFSSVPELTLGFRFFPMSLETPTHTTFRLIASGWTMLATTGFMVEDYQFNVRGERVPFERRLDLPDYGLRGGLQVTL